MRGKPFPKVPGGYPFPRLEEEVLELWRDGEIFRKSLEKPAPRGEFVFYEGPPTANNSPHVGHVVTRVVKDLFPRYRTMRGHHVARKGGWDTHGLPVEIEVEKQLGIRDKRQIEEHGIAHFNAACLESVHTYERQWRRMTERVGFWIDMDDPYITYSNEYIESVWWALAELWKRGLLEQGYKIQPYCARCGTTLSSHEVAQNYRETDDPSIWVLFPARPGQELRTVEGASWETPEGLQLLAWTTTPWTLLSHVALTVHPELSYRVVRDPSSPERLLLFADELELPLPLEVERDGERARLDLRDEPVVARIRGAELEGLRYARPFRVSTGLRPEGGPPPPEGGEPVSDELGWRVVTGDYVTTTEGTGLVHISPLFGEDDYQTGVRHGLPWIQAVDAEGKVRSGEGLEPFAGAWFKDADADIVRDLKRRGLLLHSDRYRHNYPFCWRCDQPLLYYASTSWFVRTAKAREKLVERNREIHWVPEHVGEGRFGNWLEGVVDWALSRRRYWGTPLPVWVCGGCAHTHVVGSFEELFAAAGRPLPQDPYDRQQFDPHRPGIDEIAWPCPECGDGRMERVPEVIDAWFDSGAMPFAQQHYPFAHRDLFERRFPADFISEAVDQTRGWFYTLHVLGVLLFDSAAYRNCIVLGHVNDEQGRKMSKRLGNVVDPMEVVAETGADALRWYFYVNNPELPSRFSARLVREAAQVFLLPLWNALSFFTIYANLDGWRPGGGEVPFAERPALDRWIQLRLARVRDETTEHLDRFRITPAARGLQELVEDLTNWYIRRSRDRFWVSREQGGRDKESAYQTLYEVLATLSRLLAPFTPFLAEVLHRHLVLGRREGAAESVHLEGWPEPVEGRREPELERGMAAVQRIVRLGHAARQGHQLKTRQPLASVTLVSSDSDLPRLVEPHLDLLREELNVKRVEWAEDRSAYVRHEVRPVFPRCGPRFGKRMPDVKRALAAADGDRLAEDLERDGRVRFELDTETVELAPEEVEVRLVEKEGTATQGDRELLLALDTTLTDELVREGLAREVVHRIQTRRKEEGLEYADRIRVRFHAAPELREAIEAHRDWIARETLAVELAPMEGTGNGDAVEGHPFALEIEKTEAASPRP